MKININKKLLKKVVYIAGLAFVLSGCGKQNEVDYYPFSGSEYSSDADLDNTSDSYDEDSYDDDSYDDDSYDDSNDNENEDSDQIKEILVSNASELKDYFEGDVDFSDVEDVIHNNSNLNSKDKKNLLNFVHRLEEKAPTIDLRCLYENCKLLRRVKEKNEDNDSNTAAWFDPNNHIIHLYENKKFNENHEDLHMINSFSLEKEDEKILIKRDFRIDNNTCDNRFSFLLEGFMSWFNKYLFDVDEGYFVQAADIDIIKYILDLNDLELIQTFTDENYTSITNSLGKYLKEKQIEQWSEISRKEYETLSKKSSNPIPFDELEKKYSLLLKACIASREGSISSDEMYQIITLLSNSYKNYFENYKEELSIMKGEFMDTLRGCLDYTNHDISILDTNNNPLEYCDIDQMYLIKLEGNKFKVAERYLDANGNERYYGGSSYEAKDSDIVVPINVLLNYEAEYHDSYTFSDLATIYYQYRREYVLDNDRGAYQKTP